MATLVGDSGNNTLTGTSGDDSISGLAGQDSLSGLAGNDTLDTGDNGYWARGGDGNDSITGGPYLFGENGDDTLVGSPRNISILEGGAGNDSLDGNGAAAYASYTSAFDNVYVNLATGIASGPASGNDTLSRINSAYGEFGNDTLIGDENSNRLDGGSGNDSMAGGGGSDDLDDRQGRDTIDGGSGNDNVYVYGYRKDYALTLNPDGSHTVRDLRAGSPDGTDLLINVEHVSFSDDYAVFSLPPIVGGPGNDTLIATQGDNTFHGGAGDDSLGDPNFGRNVFDGGPGNDAIIASQDNDT